MALLVTGRVGPNLSRGSELLFRWLKRESVSMNELARRVDVRSTQIVRLVHGDRRANLTLALAIGRECGIAPAAWNQEPSDKFRAQLRAVAA